jgi:L-rhamnose mutarotase
MSEQNAQRAAFVLRIKPDRVEDYVRVHEQVWPELLEAISAAGIRNYSIYLHENLAFGYLESDDLDASWAALAKNDVNDRWQEAMTEYLEARVASEGPAMLPQVFRLD